MFAFAKYGTKYNNNNNLIAKSKTYGVLLIDILVYSVLFHCSFWWQFLTGFDVSFQEFEIYPVIWNVKPRHLETF